MEDRTTDPASRPEKAEEGERRDPRRRIDREIADIARDWLDDQKSSERRRLDAPRTARPAFRP